MSMKRAKQVSRGREKDGEGESSPFGGPKVVAPTLSWKEQTDEKPDAAFTPYSMASTFQKGALLLHSKFGKGVVTHVEPQRIEVLFEDGAKKLGHGQA